MSAFTAPAAPSDRDALVEMMGEFYAETSFPFGLPRASAAFEQLLADPRCGAACLLRWNDALAAPTRPREPARSNRTGAR